MNDGTSSESTRNVSFDCLRIILMFMVVAIHAMMYSGIFMTSERKLINYLFGIGLRNISIIAVNCFWMVSGYFLCRSKFKPEKVLHFWLMILFYSLLTFIYSWTTGITPFTWRNLFNACCPVITAQYWFMTVYMALFFLSPFLNTLITAISPKQYHYLLLLLLICFSVLPSFGLDPYEVGSMHLGWAITMYLLGAYVRLYRDQPKPKKYFGLYCLMVVVSTLLMGVNILTKMKFGERYIKCEEYAHIANMVTAFFFFRFWEALELHGKAYGKACTTIASLTLGVYLLHESPFINRYIWSRIFQDGQSLNSNSFIPRAIFGIVAIYALSLLIEFIRQKLMHPLEQKITRLVKHQADSH